MQIKYPNSMQPSFEEGIWQKLNKQDARITFRLNHRFQHYSPPKKKRIQVESFLLGPTVWNVLPGLIGLIYLFVDKAVSFIIFGALIQGFLAQYILKMLLKRKRPYLQYPEIQSFDKHTDQFCFPSGHSMYFFQVWLYLAYLEDAWFYGIAIIGGIYVAYTRLLLGVHFPTDTLSGMSMILFSNWLFITFTHTYWFQIFRFILGWI